MTMTPAMRGLIGRALKQREAVGRAGVAAADQARAERVQAEARLAEEMARERDFARDRRDGAGALAVLLGAIDAAWRESAAGRLALAQDATRQADAACDTARAALAETARTAKGFDLLMERQDDEHARREARRDTLQHVMVLTRKA
jgi:hypothetical protein